MMTVRVYEVARELGLENTELMKRVEKLGIPVRNHMSSLEPADIDRVKRAIDKDKLENTVEERIRPTVVRRRTIAQPPAPEAPRAERRPAPAPKVVEAAPPGEERPAAALPVAEAPAPKLATPRPA